MFQESPLATLKSHESKNAPYLAIFPIKDFKDLRSWKSESETMNYIFRGPARARGLFPVLISVRFVAIPLFISVHVTGGIK